MFCISHIVVRAVFAQVKESLQAVSFVSACAGCDALLLPFLVEGGCALAESDLRSERHLGTSR